jgi:hypothetical protein
MRTLKSEILRLPGIEKASLNFSPQSHRAVVTSNFSIHDEEMSTQVKQIDGGYIDLYSLTILAEETLSDWIFAFSTPRRFCHAQVNTGICLQNDQPIDALRTE